MQEDNYKRFKCLLEYFVSHLEWVVNEDSNHPGYKNYIEPIQDFTKSKTKFPHGVNMGVMLYT